MPTALMFPSMGLQVLSAVLHFLGITILSHLVSRRLAIEKISSLASLGSISPARILIALIFIDSWIFVFISGVIIFGVGLETASHVCSLGIILCVMFYATSKALIYAFLVEKVHIVWAPVVGSKRSNSVVYRICSFLMLGYIAIIILMFVGRVSHLRESDQICMIGLQHYASIPLIVYDLLISVLLTILFLYPIVRTRSLSHTNPRIRRVALRTVVAAGVALVTSAVNMLILTLLHGRERGWVCLGSCTADVLVNAVALAWVTSGRGGDSESSNAASVQTPRRPAPILIARPGPKDDSLAIRRPNRPSSMIGTPAYAHGVKEQPIPLSPISRTAPESGVRDAGAPVAIIDIESRSAEKDQTRRGWRWFGRRSSSHGQQIQITVTQQQDKTVDCMDIDLEINGRKEGTEIGRDSVLSGRYEEK